MPYGFATGSTLTDLGRNLVAQESSRNALQAALAAAAAQQGVARTQAGASRYSTDAQSQGNQLTALMRIIEQQRLREATSEEVRLKEGDLALRKLLGERQFAPNDPLQLDADRKNALAIATLNADAQRAYNNRVDPRIRREELGLMADAEDFNSRIDGAIARANAESDILFDTIVGGRSNFLGLGTNQDEAMRAYRGKALTEIPLKLGEFGPYLIPQEIGGRIRWTAKRRALPSLTFGDRQEGTGIVPAPRNGTVDEEYGLEGMGNVPRGTNDQVVVRPPVPAPAFPVDQVVPQSRSSVLGGFNLAELARRIGQASAQDPTALSETAEAALRQRVSVLMLEIRQPTTPPVRKAQIIQELQRIRSLKPQ